MEGTKKMNPIPCAHCAVNFMRTTPDPEAPKLCNSCLLKEEIRNPNKEKKMDTVNIVIKCPKTVQHAIEEYCINSGIDFTQYFMSLHDQFSTFQNDYESSKIDDDLTELPSQERKTVPETKKKGNKK